MRKKLMFMLCLLLLTASCKQEMKIEEVKSEHEFSVVFENLDESLHHSLRIDNEKHINVTFEIMDGMTDIYINNPEGGLEYQGNNVSTGVFSLEDLEAGYYDVQVIGNNATGFVCVEFEDD